MEAEVRTETYGVAVALVADGVNHKCLDLAEVLAEAWAVSVDSQEWVAADLAVASEVDTECLRCLDLVEASVEACLDSAEDLEVGCGNLKTDGMLNLHMTVASVECRNCSEEDGNGNAVESST